jgi:hypothetical protein
MSIGIAMNKQLVTIGIACIAAVATLALIWQSVVAVPKNLTTGIQPNDCQRAYTELIAQNANDLRVNFYFHNWKHSTETPRVWSVDAISTDEQYHTGREDADLCKALALVWKDIEVYNSYVARDSRE